MLRHNLLCLSSEGSGEQVLRGATSVDGDAVISPEQGGEGGRVWTEVEPAAGAQVANPDRPFLKHALHFLCAPLGTPELPGGASNNKGVLVF